METQKSDRKPEEPSATENEQERRPYVRPEITEFFDPLVVFGLSGSPKKPPPPKH